MEAGDEEAEKGFQGESVFVVLRTGALTELVACLSDFMQAILERYHEEQVWSDKVSFCTEHDLVLTVKTNAALSQIRAISTYGSLAITSLNVLLFIITLLLIEPWRRRRLVANVEER